MASSRLLIFFCSILLHLVALTIAQDRPIFKNCSSDQGSFTANSTYQANRNHLLSSLTSNNSTDSGFLYVSYGLNLDRVYAIGLCRGDVNPDSCRDCLTMCTLELPRVCPNQTGAIIWYDQCMLRYSNNLFFGKMEFYPGFWYDIKGNASDAETFNKAVTSLLDSLTNKAASGGSVRKFATGNANTTDSLTIYALVQCTPDLSQKLCIECLNNAIASLPQCCDGKQGGRFLTPSCNFRYENFRFYDLTAEVPTTSPSPRKKKNHTVLIIVIASFVTSLILSIGICILFRVRKSKEEDGNVEEIRSEKSLQFDFGTLRVATDNFSDSNKLGQGGFGTVYKGMLSNGEPIAVKRQSGNSKQGEQEFKNEVLFVAKLQHRNLVRLLGFCVERKERILVYEFLPNASLDQFIFDPIHREHLNWERRYKIVEGIARGLLYLHEDSRLRIIHRDLKASNILLDSDMNPKISDFGMARLFEMDQTHSDTNRVVGTFGYMAPEYVLNGRFSVKSDVFSFGVLVLEIVSGQRRSSFGSEEESEDLLTYAWRNWNEGAALNLMDPIIRGGSTTEMMKCIHIGLLCVQENVSDRPSMTSVVNMLNGDTVTLATPSKPAFFVKSSVVPDTSSKNEASITKLSAR